MRALIITLCCGLILVFGISLVVIDLFFVRALALVVLAITTVVGLFLAQRIIGASRKVRIILFSAIGALGLIGMTNAPLKMMFALLKPRFEANADTIDRGDTPNYPIQIGSFKVIGGDIRDGSNAPYLMTSGQPYEINAFVRDSEGRFFNIWSITKLGSQWSYVEED